MGPINLETNTGMYQNLKNGLTHFDPSHSTSNK